MKPQASEGGGSIFPAGFTINSHLGCYEELQEIATRWNLHPLQLSSNHYTGRMRAFHTPQMQLAIAHHGCSTRFIGEIPRQTVVLCFPLSKVQGVRFRGSELRSGDVAVHDCRHGIDFQIRSSIEVVTVAVTGEFLRNRAFALWQTDLDFASRVLPGAPGEPFQALLPSLLEQRMGMALSDPSMLHASSHARRIENEVIDAILASLCEPRPPEAPIARHWIARRAAAMLEERFREEIDISDLCSALRASRRTLHLGFAEVYQMTPMKYLLLLRLNHVRRAIMKFRDARVSDLAADAGFSHFGRFSAAYREHFGNLPSDTRKCANGENK